MRQFLIPGETKRLYQGRKCKHWYIPCIVLTNIYKVIINLDDWLTGKLIFNFIGRIDKGKVK